MKLQIPTPGKALPGHSEQMKVAKLHYVNGNSLQPPFPKETQSAMFGLGCFWGAEKIFWQQKGVYLTAVGYAGGFTPNPTYNEVCTGRTGHNEVVRIIYDPQLITYGQLLKLFWESHIPTQGMRQGNDVGTQYRSAIYTYSHQQTELAEYSRKLYQQALQPEGTDCLITTEIQQAPEFYYAEDYHQQYLAKNPSGYCGLGGTGIQCPDLQPVAEHNHSQA